MFMYVAFKSHTRGSKAQHISVPTSSFLLTTSGERSHGLNCFGHVVYPLQKLKIKFRCTGFRDTLYVRAKSIRSCRIHRLYLCRGIRPPTTNNNYPLYDTYCLVAWGWLVGWLVGWFTESELECNEGNYQVKRRVNKRNKQ